MQTRLPNALIVGKTGSGKSTSLRNMDREFTWILDLENKVFPFPSPEFKHHYIIPRDYRNANNWSIIIKEFRETIFAAANSRECACVVVESFSKWDESQFEYQRATHTGWDVWSEHNRYILERMNEYKFWPIPIIWTGLDDVVEIENLDPNRPTRRSSLHVFGKQW